MKCDEARPRCQRCLSTDRICDGYGNASTPPLPLGRVVTSSLTTSTLRSISSTAEAQELRLYDFFRSRVVPDIAGYFGLPTWNIVLQVCATEPAVNHAVVALGALYERLSMSVQFSEDGSDRLIEIDFPLR